MLNFIFKSASESFKLLVSPVPGTFMFCGFADVKQSNLANTIIKFCKIVEMYA